MELLEKIKNSCEFVVKNSSDVEINYDKLDEVIANFNKDSLSYWLSSNPFNILDLSCREIINFLLVYHTIGDYCFWGEPKWTIDTKIGKLDGSFAMMYLLLERKRDGKDFDMSNDEFKDLLKANVEIPLLEDRYNNLVQMNKFLEEKEIDFYDQVKEMNDDKTLLNYIVTNLSYFVDESIYKGETIYFYKRAQLLTSDVLHVKKLKDNVEVDYTNLIGCADYKIPQVMRCLDMIKFSSELEKLVDSKTELEKDSSLEIEIRATTLVVIDYISKKANMERIAINDYIWLLGQDKSRITKPYHRTLTNKY